MKRDFCENVIPQAPHLTFGEEEMLENLQGLVDKFESKGSRLPGSLKDEVEKVRMDDN
jgi:hypothetical protein